MAYSLLRLTTSVLRFRPTLSAHRLPTIRHHSDNKTRSFCSNTLPNMPFNLTYLRTQMQIMVTAVKGGELTVNIPGLVKTVTDEGPCVLLPVRKRDIQVVGFEAVVDDKNLLIHVTTGEEIYLAGMKLPHNIDGNLHSQVVFTGDMLKLTIPMLKDTDIMADDTVKIARPTPYCVMFDRSDLGQKLCGLIAHPMMKSKSFTLYKKDTCERIYMKRNLPGLEKMTLTREGLCVSLSMPGLEMKDVESEFEYEYDALIIEGRRENEHYIAGVRVPEGFHREKHLIKREMQDGLYKATLPHVDVKKRVFSVYR